LFFAHLQNQSESFDELHGCTFWASTTLTRL
jgi:hypothetical protein